MIPSRTSCGNSIERNHHVAISPGYEHATRLHSRGAVGSRARAVHDLGNRETMVFTSVICQGENARTCRKNGWGRKKRTRLERVLNCITTLGISRRTIMDAYARIDAWTHGHTVDSPNDSPPPKPAVSMKQNDLWIAATTHACGATLLSTDKDFQHLDGIWFQFVYMNQ